MPACTRHLNRQEEIWRQTNIDQAIKATLAQSRSLAVHFGIFPFHLRQQIFTDRLLQDPKYFLLMEWTSAIINMPVPPTWGKREELG